MRILPIGLVVRERTCFVAGGSQDAFERVQRLVSSGARVRVFAPSLVPPLDALVLDPVARVAWEPRDLVPADLDARPFVVIDTRRDTAAALDLYARASAEGTLLCSIDQPAASTFTNLAIAEAGDVVVALGSGGNAPGLLRRLRDDIVAGLGGSFPAFTRYVRDVRALAEPSMRRDAVAEAIAGLRVEIFVHYPARWRERWKSVAPASYETGAHSLSGLDGPESPG